MHCLGFQLFQNPNSSQSSSAFKDCMFETKEINDSGLWLESSLGLCMHRLGLFGVKSVSHSSTRSQYRFTKLDNIQGLHV